MKRLGLIAVLPFCVLAALLIGMGECLMEMLQAWKQAWDSAVDRKGTQ